MTTRRLKNIRRSDNSKSKIKKADIQEQDVENLILSRIDPTKGFVDELFSLVPPGHILRCVRGVSGCEACPDRDSAAHFLSAAVSHLYGERFESLREKVIDLGEIDSSILEIIQRTTATTNNVFKKLSVLYFTVKSLICKQNRKNLDRHLETIDGLVKNITNGLNSIRDVRDTDLKIILMGMTILSHDGVPCTLLEAIEETVQKLVDISKMDIIREPLMDSALPQLRAKLEPLLKKSMRF
jgi:hypothetical protein